MEKEKHVTIRLYCPFINCFPNFIVYIALSNILKQQPSNIKRSEQEVFTVYT